MKGSGKTRLLKLISKMSKEGEIMASMSEAVLFRTNGTLCIDEFEGVSRKGNENLRELLNSCYKKGTKVKRMRKAKTLDGERQEVEEFEPYRPICMANIWGMEQVLGDRCISIILDKSANKAITRLVENFDEDEVILGIMRTLQDKRCSWCSVVVARNMYIKWNEYILSNYTSTHTHNYTKLHKEEKDFFDKVFKSDLDGRNLELALPLLLIANSLRGGIFEEVLETISNYESDRKSEEFTENRDVSFIDFVSQHTDYNFKSVTKITNEFKNFLQLDDIDGKFLNSRWVGQAMKRLNLIKEKKRLNRGVEVILDIEKAQEKIKMFK